MTDKNVDELKGRAKEAAGAVTDNQDLKNEGKADQAKHDLKDAADKVIGKAEEALDSIKNKL